MRISWDRAKEHSNQRKHGVSFREAATVFDDALAWTVGDPDHSYDEKRYLTTGYSSVGQLLIVVHTEEDDDGIRIISARRVTNNERKTYEQGE